MSDQPQPPQQPPEEPPYGGPNPNPYPTPPAYPGQGYEGQGGFPPPGGPYGGPYGSYVPQQQPGFSLQTLVRRWQNVLTRPGVPTFDEEQPAANWSTILISLVILGVTEAIFDFITGLEANGIARYTLPGGTVLPIHANPVRDAFGGLLGAFVGFFVLSGILYLSAKIFGGQGSFLTQSWLLSLFFVPLEMITAVAGIIPFVGGLVGLAALIYGIYLAVLATASAHRLPTGRATAVVLLPLAILALLVCVAAIALAALLVAILRGVGY
jgi:hypothetical protein